MFNDKKNRRIFCWIQDYVIICLMRFDEQLLELSSISMYSDYTYTVIFVF